MTAGLQIWNGGGGLILDATHRVGRALAVFGIGAGASGSWSNDILYQGQPFAAFQRAYSFGVNRGKWYLNSPVISISGNTVSWHYEPLSGQYSENVGGLIVIGVY